MSAEHKARVFVLCKLKLPVLLPKYSHHTGQDAALGSASVVAANTKLETTAALPAIRCLLASLLSVTPGQEGRQWQPETIMFHTGLRTGACLPNTFPEVDSLLMPQSKV